MKFHCDSVKLTVKKAVGRGIECAEAHSWQNKSFLKKNLGSQERRSEKVVGGGIECAAAHSWQNKRFLKKKTFAHKNEGQKKL